MTGWARIGAAAAALVVAFVAGRLTAPRAQLEERATKAEVAKVAAASSSSEASAAEASSVTLAHLVVAGADHQRRRRATTTFPDGTKVEEEEEDRAATTSAQLDLTALASAREEGRREAAATFAAELARLEELQRKLVAPVAAEPYRLGVGAHASIGLDGRRGWGPSVAGRLGPVLTIVAADVPGRSLTVHGLWTW